MKKRKKLEPLCPTCGQRRPAGWRAGLALRRSKAIKLALSKLEKKGRPRSIDYEKVYLLHQKRYRISAIAKDLGISRGVVQHALRLKEK